MQNNTNVEKFKARILASKTEVVKIGADVHARNVVVSVQQDCGQPGRAIAMDSRQLVRLCEELVKAGVQVHVCYEAGPCGYGLYRDLKRIGATAYVVVPRALGGSRRQKTDRLDAMALCANLDLYLSGRTNALTLVHVPTEEAEQKRARSRLREQCKKDAKRLGARGRSLLLQHGYHETGKWWTPKHWKALTEKLPAWLLDLLAITRNLLLPIEAQEQTLRAELEAEVKVPLPRAVGALTWILLLREVGDWHRFQNRRQVSSYTGLCPGVEQSGTRQMDGEINRCGNPRVRALLIEMVWRLVRWQPDYPPVRKLCEKVVLGKARKKLAVAAARRLAVDLWRLATGQTTPEDLNLIVPAMS